MVKGLKMKQFNSHIHSGKVNLKAFPGTKADQLNHHVKPSLEEYEKDAVIIHIGINDILRSKSEKEVNGIQRKIMNIVETCRDYNIAKIFLFSIIRCDRTTVDIDYITEQSQNYVSKTIMNLLAIRKPIT